MASFFFAVACGWWPFPFTWCSSSSCCRAISLVFSKACLSYTGHRYNRRDTRRTIRRRPNQTKRREENQPRQNQNTTTIFLKKPSKRTNKKTQEYTILVMSSLLHSMNELTAFQPSIPRVVLPCFAVPGLSV